MPELCFESNDRLDITEYTQAAMVTVGIAMMNVLMEKTDIRPPGLFQLISRQLHSFLFPRDHDLSRTIIIGDLHIRNILDHLLNAEDQ